MLTALGSTISPPTLGTKSRPSFLQPPIYTFLHLYCFDGTSVGYFGWDLIRFGRLQYGGRRLCCSMHLREYLCRGFEPNELISVAGRVIEVRGRRGTPPVQREEEAEARAPSWADEKRSWPNTLVLGSALGGATGSCSVCPRSQESSCAASVLSVQLSQHLHSKLPFRQGETSTSSRLSCVVAGPSVWGPGKVSGNAPRGVVPLRLRYWAQKQVLLLS